MLSSMSRAARLPLLVLLTAGCPPQVSSPPLLRDSEADSRAPFADDTDTEWIPHGQADPVFSPSGGAFTGTLELSITSSNGAGQVLACTASPGEVCEPTPVTGPVELSTSRIVHARVDVSGVEGTVQARSFVSVSEELLDFESTVPVLVMWTDRPAPTSSQNVAMGLDVFDLVDGCAALSDVPADSGRARSKVRGSSTAHLDKPGYDIELWQPDSEEDRPVELLGMPADGDWVLYSAYYFDDALIRNAFGYGLSNRVGRYATRTQMVELFMAGGAGTVSMNNYVGVYTLIEEIERAGHRVDVTEITPMDLTEPELTGSYVFKRDRAGDGEDGFWAGEADGAFEFSYPLAWVDPEEDEIVPVQQVYMSNLLDSLAYALVQEDFIDPASGRHYSEIIDVDSWIDHHILNLVVKNPDALRLSGYMHKDREGPIVAGPLWDLDRSAGANDYRATNPSAWDATDETWDTTDMWNFGWYGGLFDDPDFRERYWARWSELLDGELSIDSQMALIDELTEPLSEPGERNAMRWESASFPAAVESMRTWLQTRTAWIEGCIDAHEDPRECR